MRKHMLTFLYKYLIYRFQGCCLKPKDNNMGKEYFDNIPRKIDDLLTDVESGRIGLPDLQRPFVWKDNKVRDLMDSMLKGYPIGFVMLWASPEDYSNTKQIGSGEKAYKRPDDLVIDGQQRLTALLAAMRGVPVKDKNFKERYIKISFNPITRQFAVWSQAYERDSEWINAISSVFKADTEHSFSKFRKEYYASVNESRNKNNLPPLTEEEEECIENNLKDLLDLSTYSLPTMKINAKADEEDVADIFVRVNSGGQTLTEKNFIETLLAVYDNDVHDRINKFCEDSRKPQDKTAYNHILTVEPSHLIRAAFGLGFKRARLRYAYMLLRGKDLKTGIFSETARTANLTQFKEALDIVTDLNTWHEFLNLFKGAGYLKSSMIASSNAVVFSYVLYLVGKKAYKVNTKQLEDAITRWIFMSTITGFYTGSTESEVEKQFADLRSIITADDFISYIDAVIATKFTDDYFMYTLPAELNSSSAISPAWFGYVAALNVLGTPLLFSNTTQSTLLQPGSSGTKSAVDKHHIFPKNYLEKIGFNTDRDRNQIANFTYLDYQTNIDISDDPPSEYAKRYRIKLGEEHFRQTCAQNALPEGFENMEYMDFLEKRRILMAQIVKQAYLRLCGA